MNMILASFAVIEAVFNFIQVIQDIDIIVNDFRSNDLLVFR
ncbi:hypothetical protein PV433_33435 [Paenibacillus sp. GYB004]